MKRILVGTALVLFGLIPAIGSADCGPGHASMASSAPPAKPELAQAPAASKASATAEAKVAAKQAKPVAKKTTASASKADGSTVVARTN